MNFFKSNLKAIMVFLVLIIAIILYSFLRQIKANHLIINEIAFSHENGIDWIEIYNPTLNNLSLEGAYLSDKADNFSKFKIKDNIIVASGSYVVIYGNGYGDDAEAITTNFRIGNGETIYLVAKDGSSVIDSLTAIATDDAEGDFTIGRFPDGSEEIFIMSTATPGETNQKDMINNTMPIFKK